MKITEQEPDVQRDKVREQAVRRELRPAVQEATQNHTDRQTTADAAGAHGGLQLEVRRLQHGAGDALAWENYAEYPATPVFPSPIAIPFHVVKHAGYTCICAADPVFSPLYLLASIDPDNDLDPINLYTLSEGYPWEDKPFPILEDVHQDGGHRSVAPVDE